MRKFRVLGVCICGLLLLSFTTVKGDDKLNETGIEEVFGCGDYCTGYADAKVPIRQGDSQLAAWSNYYNVCMKYKCSIRKK